MVIKALISNILRPGDDTEDEGDSAAVKKDRHAAAVAPSVLRGISSDAKRAVLHLTLPLAGTPLQARITLAFGPGPCTGCQCAGVRGCHYTAIVVAAAAGMPPRVC